MNKSSSDSKGVSTLLLKSILSIYFVVLLCVTLFHLSYEYLHTESSVQRELKDVEGIFNESLTAALWAEDRNQLNAIVTGIVSLSVVTGVKVENKLSAISIEQFQEPATSFSHSYDLNYKFRDKNLYLGAVTLYSSQSVVFERIRISFLLLLVSAVIKSFFLTLLFIFAVRKFLHKPLEHLIGQIEEIKIDQMQQSDILAPVNTSSEVNELTSAFNRLKDSLSNKIEQIETSKNHFENIFQNSKVGMFQASLNGNLLTVNRYIVDLYKCLSESEVLAAHNTLSSLIGITSQEFRGRLNSLADGESLCFETEVYDAAGRVILCEFTASVICSDGSDARYIEGMLVDLSDKKAREIALREKYVAENANATKSLFLANMSHEIRTPMNAILGFTALLAEEDSLEKHKTYNRYIDNSARSLLALINDILDLSKLEAGHLEVEPYVFDLRSLLDELVASFSLQVSDLGLELLLDVDSRMPDRLIGDANRLRQILQNLVSNAIKFTSLGEVEISIGIIHTSETEVSLEFCVRDTGVGIKPEYLPHIFEAFTQEDVTTTCQFGGTGLGMSIIKGLSDRMGGDVKIHSTLGQGTICTVTLPFGVSSPLLPVITTHSQQIKKAIIVNSHARASQNMLRQFTEQGIQTLALKQIDEVAGLIKTKDFDLLLIDENTIETDTQLFNEIQSLVEYQNIKNIVVVNFKAFDLNGLDSSNTPICLVDKPLKSHQLNSIIEAVQRDLPISYSEPEHFNNERLTATGLLTNRQSGKVLLVDDVEMNRILGASILKRLGITADVASNGQMAIALLEKNHYDLVLMDVQMPVMGGFEATQIIRSQPAFSGLPIIALTASAMAGFKEKCLAQGMNDYLSKPFELDHFISTIDKWLDLDKKAAETLGDDSQPQQIDGFALGFTPGFNGDSIDELVGIDIAAVKKIWHHDPEMYRSLLQDFCSELQESCETVARLFDNDELEALCEFLHEVMGTAGFLSLTEVNKSAQVIEQAITGMIEKNTHERAGADEKGIKSEIIEAYRKSVWVTLESVKLLFGAGDGLTSVAGQSRPEEE